MCCTKFCLFSFSNVLYSCQLMLSQKCLLEILLYKSHSADMEGVHVLFLPCPLCLAYFQTCHCNIHIYHYGKIGLIQREPRHVVRLIRQKHRESFFSTSSCHRSHINGASIVQTVSRDVLLTKKVLFDGKLRRSRLFGSHAVICILVAHFSLYSLSVVHRTCSYINQQNLLDYYVDRDKGGWGSRIFCVFALLGAPRGVGPGG